MPSPDEPDSDPSYFRHVCQDDSTSVTEELLISSQPQARLEFRILTEGPRTKSVATFLLARYRVRALVHMLQGWLDATQDSEP